MQQLKRAIFHVYHDIAMSGHGGTQKTYKAISEVFYWRNMRKEVLDFIKGCEVCQKVKYPTDKKQGLLQPLPIPDRPWVDLTMDFIVGLPSSRGFMVVLVMVVRFTKGVHFNPLRPSFTTSQVADIFLQIVIKLHGFP